MQIIRKMTYCQRKEKYLKIQQWKYNTTLFFIIEEAKESVLDF